MPFKAVVAMVCLTACYVTYMVCTPEPADGALLGILGGLFGAYAGITVDRARLEQKDGSK